MASRIRWGVGVGICCICLVSLGCLQVPVCIPEMNTVPAVGPTGKGDEVFAFRVDVTDRAEIKESRNARTPSKAENVESFALSRMPVSTSGMTSAQTSLTCATGWYTVGFWNYFNSLTTHSIAVRLYRRGYETIELRPGQAPRELRWVEAVDVAAQEKAVDDLLGISPLESERPLSETQQRRLEPGTTSPAHRDALTFAAREYERLAHAVAREGDDVHEAQPRLFRKARRVTQLAEGR
jgi:hypothetical protein